MAKDAERKRFDRMVKAAKERLGMSEEDARGTLPDDLADMLKAHAEHEKGGHDDDAPPENPKPPPPAPEQPKAEPTHYRCLKTQDWVGPTGLCTAVEGDVYAVMHVPVHLMLAQGVQLEPSGPPSRPNAPEPQRPPPTFRRTTTVYMTGVAGAVEIDDDTGLPVIDADHPDNTPIEVDAELTAVDKALGRDGVPL